MLRPPCCLAIALLALATMAAVAAEGTSVYQKGRMFSTSFVVLRRGQPITFVNDDTVPHNVLSSSGPNHFDLGSQLPGTAVPVSFDEPGTVDVICAIHPRMRMTIKVVD